MNNRSLIDIEPAETQEWLDAFSSVLANDGTSRALYLLQQLEDQARQSGVMASGQPFSSYRNTIPVEAQGTYPGDLLLEDKLTSIIRWNALAMVVKANMAHGELGGHIASFASVAEIFETGFNHFFHADDLVFFQPHSAPGVYARAFLEGYLSEDRLARYRQEVGGKGLSSYPHPWLMPSFWQFPTGSMGLGPINAVYQARFMRYLQHRDLKPDSNRHVWGVFGDGEMDEPESIAGLTLAAREQLDNLTFIVNCNLQRLDGPVRGNGQIIQELEALFVGAGWNVIKVLWGSEWDALFARDTNHILLRRFAETVDGQYQNLGAKDGDYNREKFFQADPQSNELVRHLSDSEINALKRGGHDFRKLYAAFAAAKSHQGRPSVILAKTKKGFGMGGAGESRMTAHQAKKLDIDALLAYRDRFALPLTDPQVEALEFYKPAPDSPELVYLQARRSALGGHIPRRRPKATANLQLKAPAPSSYAKFALGADGKSMSTTMAMVRLLSGLLKNPDLGPYIVPIVADEARTFGMASLFRQIGIYAPQGQLYEPEDAGSMLSYKESKDGQLLEEGITEAGAMSSWIAAATAYSAHERPMLPFYIYYSMFGFQRVGDLIWAAADQRARGFLLGATAGRTTLSGEGLQHQDGSSHIIAATVPNCRAYDPAFAYELAVIIDHGCKQMLDNTVDEFYYLTIGNENYPNPTMPDGVSDPIIRGMYKITTASSETSAPRVRLLGSGSILNESIAAADILRDEFDLPCEVFSVTSYSELARDARAAARSNRLHGNGPRQRSYVSECLPGSQPIIAASDYVCAYPQLIAAYLAAPFISLGTDGFGRSDSRENLRHFFEVDRHHIVLAAVDALVERGELGTDQLAKARERIGLPISEQPAWDA